MTINQMFYLMFYMVSFWKVIQMIYLFILKMTVEVVCETVLQGADKVLGQILKFNLMDV